MAPAQPARRPGMNDCGVAAEIHSSWAQRADPPHRVDGPGRHRPAKRAALSLSGSGYCRGVYPPLRISRSNAPCRRAATPSRPACRGPAVRDGGGHDVLPGVARRSGGDPDHVLHALPGPDRPAAVGQALPRTTQGAARPPDHGHDQRRGRLLSEGLLVADGDGYRSGHAEPSEIHRPHEHKMPWQNQEISGGSAALDPNGTAELTIATTIRGIQAGAE